MGSYGNLVSTILGAPFWVQEALFMDVLGSFEEKLGFKAEVKTEDIYVLYVPELTFKGKKEFDSHEHGHDPNLYKILQSTLLKKRVVDITIDNFMSLEDTSKLLSECIKQEYIKPPVNEVVSASIYYMSGEIRLGEYAKRAKLIDVVQLDSAMRRQKELNMATGKVTPIGEVLIELGFLTKEAIAKIILIKDDSKRRFVFGGGASAPAQQSDDVAQSRMNIEMQQMKMQLQRYAQENQILKEKLRAVFNLQNKNK